MKGRKMTLKGERKINKSDIMQSNERRIKVMKK
jgi:hypothetical protein